MRRILTILMLLATPLLAQLPVVGTPQINLTGNIGCIGFPCLNTGKVVFSSDANRTMTALEASATGGILVTSSVSLTATRNLVLPAGNFQFVIIENGTTGGQAIQVIGQSGTGVVISNGQSATVWFDGTKVVQAGTSGAGFISSLTTTGSSGPATVSGGVLNVPIYSGGGMVYPGTGVAVSNGSSWVGSLTAPSGALVGTTDVQSLTNKTVDGVTPTTMAFVDPTSSVQTQLGSKAPIASPTFTGTVTAPVYVATGGTPGIVTPTLQLTGTVTPGCATLDAYGNLTSTGTACANVAGVTSLNTLTGAMVLTGGSNIALTTVGNNITINGLVNAPVQTEYTPGGPRALSTVYQNLTTRLMFVTVFFLNSNTTDYGTAFGYTDATATPVQYGGGCTSPAANGGLNTPCSFTMAVAPNNYYEVKIFGAFGDYFTWFESQP